MLLTTTNAMAQESLILKEGEYAPYGGVLVPEEQYRQMSIDIIEKDLLKSQRLEAGYEENSFDGRHFLYGVGLGLI